MSVTTEYAPPRSRVADKENPIELRWGPVLKAWWSMAWRGFLYGLGGGFVFGAIGGVLAVILGDPSKAAAYGTVGGYIAAVLASMLAFKQAIQKHLGVLAQIAQQTVAADRREDAAPAER